MINRNVPPKIYRRSGRGFTLIELLIVIAIILILIAIALPNFLEAQIRARVTKAKGELRSLQIALESYALDWKFYPCQTEGNLKEQVRSQAGLAFITSPVAYISALPEDPFPDSVNNDPGEFITYEGGGTETTKFVPSLATEQFTLYSRGPSQKPEPGIRSAHPNWTDGAITTYSPTNGTKSDGTISIWLGDGRWIGINTGSPSRGRVEFLKDPSRIQPLMVDGQPYLKKLPPSLQ